MFISFFIGGVIALQTALNLNNPLNALKNIIRLWQGILFISLYPISILSVALLKKYSSFDK